MEWVVCVLKYIYIFFAGILMVDYGNRERFSAGKCLGFGTLRSGGLDHQPPKKHLESRVF